MTAGFTYLCYGLHIKTSLRIPELVSTIASDLTESELTVEVCPTSDAKHSGLESGYSIGSSEQILFHLPDLATFVIKDGREIRIFQQPGANEETIRLYLLGSVLGAAVHQRGMLPLHASAVKTVNGVVAFSAASGVGKSTTAALLGERGFDIVSDDVLALKPHPSGRVAAFGGPPVLRLLPDAAARLQRRKPDTPINQLTGKHHLASGKKELGHELRLSRIYFIEAVLPEVGHARVRRISNIDALMHVASNVYRPELIHILGAQRRVLAQAASVVANAECFVLERPRCMVDLDGWADTVERHITAER